MTKPTAKLWSKIIFFFISIPIAEREIERSIFKGNRGNKNNKGNVCPELYGIRKILYLGSLDNTRRAINVSGISPKFCNKNQNKVQKLQDKKTGQPKNISAETLF